MKNILLIIAVCVAIIPFNLLAQKSAKSDIKVLIVAHNPSKVFVGGYAGPKASPRQDKLARTRGKEFKELLDPYFKTVDIINSDSYTANNSDGYDVIIMDDLPKPIEEVDLGLYRKGKSIVRGGRPMMYPRYLPEDYDRATIAIGQITDDLTYIYSSKLMTQ